MIKIFLNSIMCVFSVLFMDNKEHIFGNYTYSSASYLYMESINFEKESMFTYTLRTEFIKERIEGYYIIKSDTVILNSLPQKEKIIVKEGYKNRKKIFFEVTDKQYYPINYNLYVILVNDSIIEYRDQFQNSKLTNLPIKAFYIITTRGLKSPMYVIRGTNTNYFKIMLEENRVFEAEKWLIKNDEIIPLGLDGNYVNYSLKKRDYE